MFYSVVVPTFSRPDEVIELLTSLVSQQNKNIEVIIADGSPDDAVERVIKKFNHQLNLQYLYHKGLGISESRNWGVENAKGDFIVFFDSDCVIPPHYFSTVDTFLAKEDLDAYGGPDRADAGFNNMQKAISYAMTSFFTTGGIRGGVKHMGKFQPRSFNMGIRRSVFNALGGFSGLKVSEDIDLSMRLHKNGYRTGLIKEAYVFHKRRSTFYKFYRQVFSFGRGRIDLQLRHGDALKLVHTLPSVFVVFIIAGLFTFVISRTLFWFWLIAVITYSMAVCIHATIKNRNIMVGLLSVYASFIMLAGYGLGMIKAIFMRILLGSSKESEKPEITKEA